MPSPQFGPTAMHFNNRKCRAEIFNYIGFHEKKTENEYINIF